MKNILIILGLIVSFSNILLAQSTVTFAQDFRRLSNATLVVAVQAKSRQGGRPAVAVHKLCQVGSRGQAFCNSFMGSPTIDTAITEAVN